MRKQLFVDRLRNYDNLLEEFIENYKKQQRSGVSSFLRGQFSGRAMELESVRELFRKLYPEIFPVHENDKSMVIRTIGKPESYRGWQVIGPIIIGKREDKGLILFSGEASFPIRRIGDAARAGTYRYQVSDERGNNIGEYIPRKDALEVSHNWALGFSKKLVERVKDYYNLKVVDSK